MYFLLKFATSLALDHPPIKKVDVIIAISTRATRGDENYQKTKDVISSIIDEFGRERIHYGVLLFGKPPQITVRLGDYHDTDDKLMAVINNFPPDKSNADLAEVKLIMRLKKKTESVKFSVFCMRKIYPPYYNASKWLQLVLSWSFVSFFPPEVSGFK